MSKENKEIITPWEELPTVSGQSTLLRIADSDYAVGTYDCGYAVGRLNKTSDKNKGIDGYRLAHNSVRYPSTLPALIRCIAQLGHTIYKTDSVGKAFEAHVKACEAAAELAQRLEVLCKTKE